MLYDVAPTPTPDWLAEKIRTYYRETTTTSYLKSWSPEGLAFHMGMHQGESCTHEESLANTTRFLAQKANVVPGARVLDAGCGVGSSSFLLAREFGASVVGITIEGEQARLATAFAADRGLSDRVTFREMDFMATDFEPGSFDVVWNLESFCYAHDPAAYLRHARSLLRPGGRFACVDVFRGHQGPDAHHEALSAGCVLPALGTREDACANVREAGFQDIEDEDVTAKILRSAEILRQKTRLRKMLLELERVLTGSESLVYAGHTTGALGAAEGFFSGAVTYGYVGGRR